MDTIHRHQERNPYPRSGAHTMGQVGKRERGSWNLSANICLQFCSPGEAQRGHGVSFAALVHHCPLPTWPPARLRGLRGTQSDYGHVCSTQDIYLGALRHSSATGCQMWVFPTWLLSSQTPGVPAVTSPQRYLFEGGRFCSSSHLFILVSL